VSLGAWICLSCVIVVIVAPCLYMTIAHYRFKKFQKEVGGLFGDLLKEVKKED
jgi:hypothetical protein